MLANNNFKKMGVGVRVENITKKWLYHKLCNLHYPLVKLYPFVYPPYFPEIYTIEDIWYNIQVPDYGYVQRFIGGRLTFIMKITFLLYEKMAELFIIN